MRSQEQTPLPWKREVYRSYRTLFQSQGDESVYSGFIPYGQHIINTCFPKAKSARILDIGCGIGGLIKVCLDRGYSNIEGIDISEESVAIAHANGMHQVTQGDIFDYLRHINESSLDVVLCLDVIEHFFREDSIKILQESFRVLKPGGTIVIHVPNAEGIFGSKVRYADYTHEMAFTKKSLEQILRFTGFDSSTCYEDKPIVHGFTSAIRRILWSILTLPFRLLHAAETGSFDVKLSQNILCMGQKPIFEQIHVSH